MQKTAKIPQPLNPLWVSTMIVDRCECRRYFSGCRKWHPERIHSFAIGRAYRTTRDTMALKRADAHRGPKKTNAGDKRSKSHP